MSDQRNGGIAWTDQTWNCVRGCSKVSEGCRNCYAMAMAARFSGPGQPYKGLAVSGPARWTGKVRLILEHLNDPLRWKRPRRIFVNSMSDLFHEGLSTSDIDTVFSVMSQAKQHTFQVLTKRPLRMRNYMSQDYMSQVKPLPNVWLGVSVEDQATADERIPLLLQTPAAVRFVSAEPMLGPVDLGLQSATCDCCPRWSSRWVHISHRVTADVVAPGIRLSDKEIDPGIHRASSNRHGALSVGDLGIKPAEFTALPAPDWVIAGGESGPGARPMHPDWIASIVAQCAAAAVPCFVKQLGAWRPQLWGGTPPASGGNWGTLEGGGKFWLGTTPWNGRQLDDSDTREVVMIRVGGHQAEPAEWPAPLRVRQFPTP